MPISLFEIPMALLQSTIPWRDRHMQPSPKTKPFHASIARIAAYIAGETMDYVKVLKLVYLSDRESLRRFGTPITYDDYQALTLGPVPDDLHQVLEHREHRAAGWNGIIEVIGDVKVDRVVRSLIPSEEAAAGLSEASIKVIDSVLNKHRNKTRDALIRWTHDNCIEWKRAYAQGRKRISYSEILLALGRTPTDAAEIESSIQAYRTERAMLARA